MPPKNFPAIRRKLLRWYDHNRRDLPWRRSRDPYAIWIAETMLQQTQIAAVLPFYGRFLKSFPSIAALARAPLGKVMARWSGLGYYRRARNFKAAAEKLVREHAGILPADYDRLLSLPGVGAYTAGALMSIAFGQPYPAIDGNVRRVLGRLVKTANEKSLRAAAARLVSKPRPGDFNQALMDLGASLCAAKNPLCPNCPLRRDCATRAAGRAPRKKNTGFKAVTWPLAVIRSGGSILLRRRSSDGLLAGLWEMPGGELRGRAGMRTALKNHLQELNANFAAPRRIGELRHSITNRKIRAPIFLFEAGCKTAIRLPGPRWRWVAPAALHRFPVSSMTLKAAKLLAAYE